MVTISIALALVLLITCECRYGIRNSEPSEWTEVSVWYWCMGWGDFLSLMQEEHKRRAITHRTRIGIRLRCRDLFDCKSQVSFRIGGYGIISLGKGKAFIWR